MTCNALVRAIRSSFYALALKQLIVKTLVGLQVVPHFISSTEQVYLFLAQKWQHLPWDETTMLNACKRQNGVALGQWLLRGPSRREVLLTSTTRATVPGLLV